MPTSNLIFLNLIAHSQSFVKVMDCWFAEVVYFPYMGHYSNLFFLGISTLTYSRKRFRSVEVSLVGVFLTEILGCIPNSSLKCFVIVSMV
jgi:hypothetical protein